MCVPHGRGGLWLPVQRPIPPEAMILQCLVGAADTGIRSGAASPVPLRASPRGPAPLACPQVLSWAQQQGERLQAQTASLAAEREEMAQLIDWITAAEEALSLRDQEPLPEEAEQLEELNAQHTVRDPAPSSPTSPGAMLSPPPCLAPGKRST